MSENPTPYNEAISEETRQYLADYNAKVLALFEKSIPKPKRPVEGDFQLLQELRNMRFDLELSGMPYYAKLIELAIIEMGFTP